MRHGESDELVNTIRITRCREPRHSGSPRQREMAWYQLFFQFEGIAEPWLQNDDWALLRELSRGNG